MQLDRKDLAPGLTIRRILTGLWQVADQERDGNTTFLVGNLIGDFRVEIEAEAVVRPGVSKP